MAAPPCPACCANARGAAAKAVAAAPVVSMVRLTGSIMGALLDPRAFDLCLDLYLGQRVQCEGPYSTGFIPPFYSALFYSALAGSPILSCVLVSKSLASWRSCNWLAGSPEIRLTMRPRFTAGRFAIASVQRCTFLYSCTDRNSPAPYTRPFASAPYHGQVAMSAIV